jgi:hypothetical protein
MHKVPSHLLQNPNSSNSRENIVWAISIKNARALNPYPSTTPMEPFCYYYYYIHPWDPFMLVKISVACV